jgi:hypothetical protein
MAAAARITHTWPDGSNREVVLSVDATFADAVDEVRSQCAKLWNETRDEADPLADENPDSATATEPTTP